MVAALGGVGVRCPVMTNGPARDHGVLGTPPPQRFGGAPAWAYWCTAVAVLAVLLYLFFLLPNPDTLLVGALVGAR